MKSSLFRLGICVVVLFCSQVLQAQQPNEVVLPQPDVVLPGPPLPQPKSPVPEEQDESPEAFLKRKLATKVGQALSGIMSLVEARKDIPIENQIVFAKAVLEFPFPGKGKTKEINALAKAKAALDTTGEARKWSQFEVFRWRALNNLYRRFSAAVEEQKEANDLYRVGKTQLDFLFDATNRRSDAAKEFFNAAFRVFPLRSYQANKSRIYKALAYMTLRQIEEDLKSAEVTHKNVYESWGKPNVRVEAQARQRVYALRAKLNNHRLEMVTKFAE